MYDDNHLVRFEQKNNLTEEGLFNQNRISYPNT